VGLLRDTRGAQIVEYLMLVGLIALTVLLGYRSYSAATTDTTTGQAACVDALSCGQSPGNGGPTAGEAETGTTTAAVATPSGAQPATAPATPSPSGGGSGDGGKSIWRRGFDVGKGFVLGAWDTVTGIVHVVTHPVETAKGLWTAVTNPVQTAKAIKEAVVTAWNDNPEEFIGRALFEIVSIPVAVGKASKLKYANAARSAGEAGKVANTADNIADAAKIADKAESAADVIKAEGVFGATQRTMADAVGGFCFVAGTMVLTESGLRPIERVAVGDLVVARDERTGETGLRRVAHTFVRHQRQVLSLQLTAADGTIETIGVTPEHPFFVAGRGWIGAGELALGVEVQSQDGRPLRVESLTQLADVATVYNFEVEQAHTYFVGATGAWVHNDCRANIKGLRLQQLTDDIKHGKFPKNMTPDELKQVQANALRTAERTFTNQFGDDTRLLDAVRAKKGAFDDALKKVDDSIVKGRPLTQQQLDSLRVMLRTFQGTDAGDVALRGAVLEKLGKMGRAKDIDDILPLVRKPPTSADLYNGLESIHGILHRAGSPQLRGAKHLSSDTKALLGKSALSEAERARVIEDVMRHGEIASVKKHVGGNMNEVYFVTYKDKVALADGSRVPVRAVFKPEKTYVGKEKPFFTREVSAYEFDRDFAKTGTVPPTVEGVLAGKNVPQGTGSLQYMIPGAEPLGKDAVHLNPKFKPFLESAEGQKQMGEIRTLLYTLNDPDKLPNPGGFKSPNYGNIMAVPDAKNPGKYRLYMIDNGGGQGALGTKVTKDILPSTPSKAADNLSHTDPGSIERALEPLVGEKDAADIARRSSQVRKPRRRTTRRRIRRAAGRGAARASA
jgi:Flp pilus assembly pilin Flp